MSLIQEFLEQAKKVRVKSITVNEPKRVIVVVYDDGSKQIVKCHPDDNFDLEIGFSLAMARQAFGSRNKLRNYLASKAYFVKQKEKKQWTKKSSNAKQGE